MSQWYHQQVTPLVPNLTQILGRKPFTLQDVEELVLSPDLRELNFPVGCSVPDGTLTLLSQLPALHSLSFSGTSFSPDALEAFARFPRLHQLTLAGCHLTDEHARALRLPPSLRQLDLPRNQITDPGVQALATHLQITWLDLSSNPITDEAFDHLNAMQKLQVLWIQGCRVTSSGLLKLNQTRKLTNVAIQRTTITDADLMQLQLNLLGKLRDVSPAVQAELTQVLLGFCHHMKHKDLKFFGKDNGKGEQLLEQEVYAIARRFCTPKVQASPSLSTYKPPKYDDGQVTVHAFHQKSRDTIEVFVSGETRERWLVKWIFKQGDDCWRIHDRAWKSDGRWLGGML